MKIRLERFKEIVRLNSDFEIEEEKDTLNMYLKIGNSIIPLIYRHSEIVNYISAPDVKLLKRAVQEYNNSIKDDGYKWICKVCQSECKTKQDSLLLKCKISNFQPIPNNEKIEIIEED